MTERDSRIALLNSLADHASPPVRRPGTPAPGNLPARSALLCLPATAVEPSVRKVVLFPHVPRSLRFEVER